MDFRNTKDKEQIDWFENSIKASKANRLYCISQKEKFKTFNENCCCDKKGQTHTHEFLGSTKIAEKKEDPHNHRFAGVTGEAIPTPCGHIHKLETNTDFYENHFHMICDETGPAIPVCEGRHVHFVKGCTSL